MAHHQCDIRNGPFDHTWGPLLMACGFRFFFFFNDTATTEIYTLSLHDALPIWMCAFPEYRGPNWRTRFYVHSTGCSSTLDVGLCRRALNAGEGRVMPDEYAAVI